MLNRHVKRTRGLFRNHLEGGVTGRNGRAVVQRLAVYSPGERSDSWTSAPDPDGSCSV